MVTLWSFYYKFLGNCVYMQTDRQMSPWQHNAHCLSLLLLLSVSVHSPVPTWGHLSQLRPQALPTVQQHISWVRWVGSGCSQPLASDAIRKHRACSAGDSEADRGDSGGFIRGMRRKFNVIQVDVQREERNSPTHRFLSNTKPALQEHLKLPSVFRQSPFWQTPCMEHSLISSRSGCGVQKWKGYFDIL